MAVLRALLLAAVFGVVWYGESTSGSFPESIAVERSLPSFSTTTCVKSSATVRFYEIAVKGSDSDAVYRRITANDVSLTFGSNETIDFNATNVYECAKAVAVKDLAAFSYNDRCTGYRLHKQFFGCAKGEVVLYVRTDHLDDEMAVVPFDKAPKILMDDGRSPFKEYYIFMARDVIFIEDGHVIYAASGNIFPRGVMTLIRENGDFIWIINIFIDVKNCFTDNANGVPLYVNAKEVKTSSGFLNRSIYFLDVCGETIQTQSPDRKLYLIYSHAGVGCIHYPADAPDECTVTLDMPKYTEVLVRTLKSDDNTECGGLDFNLTTWSTTIMGTETYETCDEDGTYYLNPNDIYDRATISLLTRPSKQTVGFVIEIA